IMLFSEIFLEFFFQKYVRCERGLLIATPPLISMARGTPSININFIKTTEKMKTLEIKGRDVLKCTLIEKGISFKVDKDHKMFKETYSNYALKGKVISVNDKGDFAKDHKAGLIYSIDVIEGPSPDDVEKIVWSFAGYTTTDQEIKMAETEHK